jgi:flagellar basal-body rod modification protein FlgD
MTSAIQTLSSNPTYEAQPQTPSAILGKDDFLKLLVMQLRFQDPMSPLKGTEFAAQLAQFSSVEQLSNMSTQLTKSNETNAVLTRSINNALAATFIGKGVRAGTDTFQYNGTGIVKLGYNLSSNAETVVVKVHDASGNVVRTINAVPTNKGDNNFEWNGKDDAGKELGSGKYTFTVDAKGNSGESLTASQFIYGTVSGVRFKSDGTVFVIGGVEISLSNVLEIMQG